MGESTIETALQEVRTALEMGEVQQAIAVLTRLRPPDRADAFESLDDGHRAAILPELDLPTAADLLEELEDPEAASIAEALSPEKLADVLDEMEPDEAADLLGDLPAEHASEALAQMEEAGEVIPLLRHEDETAGGLMTTTLALRARTTAAQAIEFLRRVEPDERVPYYLYVVDRDHRLLGVVGLRELVVADAGARIESLMATDVIHVTTETDQEEAARLMARYDLAALPVVDQHGVLQGVITHDDIIDVLQDEATEDLLHLGGIESGPINDKPYWSQSIREVVRSRFV